MRLIDLDKVRWKEGFYDMHTGEQYASMIFNTEEWLEWATAEAEVKAIPIKFIKKYYEDITVPYSDTRIQFEELIKKWEEENGRSE